MKDVGIKEFEEAIDRVIGGIERKLPISVEERKTVAYHEAGHAVCGWFLENSNPLLKVTILPRSKGALGFAQYLPEEVSLYSTEQLKDMICMALGGRVSEEIFFNKVTTGASDDIKKVTQIAYQIVTNFGMVAALGTVNYEIEEGYQKPFSEKTGRMIDIEAKRIVDSEYERCKQLLTEKRELVEKLGAALLSKETLTLPDLVDTLGMRPFPLKESLIEYLEELRSREQNDKYQKDKKDREDVEAAERASQEEIDKAEENEDHEKSK